TENRTMRLLTIALLAAALTAATPFPTPEAYTMPTPYGQASIAVQDGLAIMSVAGIDIGPLPLGLMPLLPGMEGAVVAGGWCITKKFGGTSPHNRGVVVLTVQVKGYGSSLAAAIADLKKQVGDAGAAAHPCGQTVG
ncbi:MAG TPA: hypothetical protein VFD43_00230, partial [Planctomycetota bacterium]|nr:hypothetical protein [Planctomycetota bacterium]